MEREVGGGIGMGKTCKLKDVSFQCMTKFTTKKKKKKPKACVCPLKVKKNKKNKKKKVDMVLKVSLNASLPDISLTPF